MSIKRRLFISNLLMWLIPIAVGIVVYLGGVRVFAAIAGFEGRARTGRPYMEAVGIANEAMDRWLSDGAEINVMTREAGEFNERYADNGQAIMIYRDGENLTPTKITPEREIIDNALTAAGGGTIFGRVTARARAAGDYRIVFYEDMRFIELPVTTYRNVMYTGMIAAFTAAAVMVFITNLYLTRFVFKRILRALGILSNGVQQISDGNLDYRIEYRSKDEFTSVCGDFNQMAGRLMLAAELRERDERSRRELIAGISHDLRTPLTSIMAYVEGLEHGIASTPEARKRYVDTIKDKAGDLEHIIEQLFLFSKLDTDGFPYHIERVDLGTVVSEITSGVSGEYRERGLDIETRIVDANLFVNIDAMQTRRVLINIFENSLKYKNKERGRIVVRVAREGGEAALSMTDDGPGVPEEALPKLPDLFYRSDEARSNPGRGSGLGLAIAAKIINRFGGGIDAENAAGGLKESGLKIKIRLPVVP